MPLKLQILSAQAAQWVSWCKQKLYALSSTRLKGQTYKRIYILPNGIKAQIISSDMGDVIRIWGELGFICHPRSDLYPGGISSKDDKPITAVYTYPLIDDDHGSVILTPPEWTLSTDAENYGNVDWLDSDGAATTFRGPCGRSLEMDSLNNYPGLTIFDYETKGDLPVEHYTPYQNLTYVGGDINLTYPVGTKVIGVTDTYTILSVDYTGRTNPDGGVGGFYTEIWEGLKTRIGFLHDSRPDVPWFFNKSGTEAVSSNKKLNIITNDKGVSSVIFGTLPQGSGTDTTAMVQGVSWSLARKGDFPMYYDYVGDVLSNIKLKIDSLDSSVKTGSDAENFGTFPVKISGTLTPEVFTITLGAGAADPWGMGLAIVEHVTTPGLNCGCAAPVDVWSRKGYNPAVGCATDGDRRTVTATRTISCTGVADAVATITVDYGPNEGTGMGWVQSAAVTYPETTGSGCYGEVSSCCQQSSNVYSSGPTMYWEDVECLLVNPGHDCTITPVTPLGSYTACSPNTYTMTCYYREQYTWACLADYSSSLWYFTIHGNYGPAYVP